MHMTYLDRDPISERNNYNVYADYIDSHPFAPGNLAQDPNGILYYPNGNPAPLATLEPVQEVATPEENSAMTLPSTTSTGFHPYTGSPGYASVVVTTAGTIQIPRVHSDGSTNV